MWIGGYETLVRPLPSPCVNQKRANIRGEEEPWHMTGQFCSKGVEVVHTMIATTVLIEYYRTCNACRSFSCLYFMGVGRGFLSLKEMMENWKRKMTWGNACDTLPCIITRIIIMIHQVCARLIQQIRYCTAWSLAHPSSRVPHVPHVLHVLHVPWCCKGLTLQLRHNRRVANNLACSITACGVDVCINVRRVNRSCSIPGKRSPARSILQSRGARITIPPFLSRLRTVPHQVTVLAALVARHVG